jgi:hypothetical protein
MNPLDLIRTTHEIDRHLAELSAAVSDEAIKKDLADFHARWCELGYHVSANLCALTSKGDAVAPKRRGRPRRNITADVASGAEDRSGGAGS